MGSSSPGGRGIGGVVLAVSGGLVAVAGAFQTWGTATVSFRGGDLFGTRVRSGVVPGLPTGEAGLRPLSFSGTSDWTGMLAALAGAVIVVAALTFLAKARPSGGLSLFLMAGGVVIIVAAAQGLVDLDRIARNELVAPARDAIGGLLGGVLDKAIDQIGNLFEVEARAAAGLYLSMAGGIAAVIGGALTLPGRHRVENLERASVRPYTSPS